MSNASASFKLIHARAVKKKIVSAHDVLDDPRLQKEKKKSKASSAKSKSASAAAPAAASLVAQYGNAATAGEAAPSSERLTGHKRPTAEENEGEDNEDESGTCVLL